MTRVTCDLSVSVDGYSAGLRQTEERPFGDDGGDGSGAALHAWMFDTPEENRVELARMAGAGACVIWLSGVETPSFRTGRKHPFPLTARVLVRVFDDFPGFPHAGVTGSLQCDT